MYFFRARKCWNKDPYNFHAGLTFKMFLDFTPQTINACHWKSPEVKWATCFQQLNWMFPLVACNDFLIALEECDGRVVSNELPVIALDLSFSPLSLLFLVALTQTLATK